MKYTLIMLIALFAIVRPIAGQATPGEVRQFVALWEAVDPDDGSHQVLSITDNGDGTVKLLLYDTSFTLCGGGTGIGRGTGQPLAGRSLKSDDFSVTCFETNETQTTPTTFTLDHDGTLFRLRATLSPIIYHRTSK
jgi:hypothetical protein